MRRARHDRANARRRLPSGSLGACARAWLGCEVLEERRLLSAVPLSHTELQMLAAGGATPSGGSATAFGFSPAQIRHAYGFDQVTFNSGTIQGDGSGQTIAIIDAYDDPNIASDLASFDSAFGIAAPPNFIKVAQDGSTNYPTTDPAGPGTNNWEVEEALDVEWAHAMAPGATIMLVEANSPNFNDLITSALTYAAQQPGVVAVSMSFGTAEFSTETSWDFHFTTPTGHAPVTFLAATGDAGSPGNYPAFSPNVMAVGGTQLTLDANNNYAAESGWSGSGGGISQFESQPTYQSQSGLVTQSSTFRTIPDVSFDAALTSNTGVGSSPGLSVYDSYNNGTVTPWVRVGGTSAATPCWAGLVAVADQGRALAGLAPLDGPSQTLAKIYSLSAGDFHDITSGSNNKNSAVAGYDLVTGRGSPLANLMVPGLMGTASVAGEVFNDVNGNGALDAGESGLPGWTVYEDLNGNGVYDAASTHGFTNNTATSFASSVTSSQTVSGLSGNIVRVTVNVNITYSHPDGNLTISLVSPNNTTIVLANQVGGSGTNFSNTTFDDFSLSIPIALGSAPFTGTFSPSSPLWTLFGGAPNGTWSLKINNAVSFQHGTLNSWSINLTTGDPAVTTGSGGLYQLNNPLGGTFSVGEVLQAPYAQTSPPGGFSSVSVGTGVAVKNVNFGDQLPPSTTPGAVTLLSSSDTGVSNSDNLTNLNNSSAQSALQFQVAGTVAGALVTLYADGNLIGSATASGSTTVVTTNGTFTLSDGPHSITARQTQNGQPISGNSSPLSIQIDTTAPVGSIAAVTPNPHTAPVSSMTITFSEPVSNLPLADLQLTVGGGPNLLTAAQTLSTSDNVTWVLNNLATITSSAGNYQLSLIPGNAPFTDWAGNVDTNQASTSFLIPLSVQLNTPSIDYANPQTWPAPAGSQTGEAAGGVAIASNAASITDVQSSTLQSMTVTLAGASATSGDFLIGISIGNISVSRYSQLTGQLVFTGVDSLANYLAALKSVVYNNSVGGPGKSSESISVVVNDGTSLSNTALATITIAAPPSVKLNLNTFNYATQWTNQGAVTVAGAPVLADPRSGNLTSLTITLASPQPGDLLAATPVGNVSVSAFNSVSGQLILSGTDSLANYQTALASVIYNNTSGGPGVATEFITVSDADATGASNTATSTINVNASGTFNSLVSGGYLFYDNSGYNGNKVGIGTKDNAAIDPSKTPYLGTTTATFASLSGFTKGINGLMIDLTPSSTNNHGAMSLANVANDFTFRASGVGVTNPSNNPQTWSAAPAATGFTVRLGAGAGGSDRIEITWPDGAIENEWLEVTVNANAETGLASPYTFFFGNLIGDTGDSNSASTAVVTGTDEIDMRQYVGAAPAPVFTVYDVNKDKSVDANDELAARNNPTFLRFIKVGSGNFAPQTPPATQSAAPAATQSISATPALSPAIVAPSATTASATNPIATSASQAVASTLVDSTAHRATDSAIHAPSLLRAGLVGHSASSFKTVDVANAAASALSAGLDESLLELLALARRHAHQPRKL